MKELDDAHVRLGAEPTKCEKAVVGCKEFVSIFTQFGVGESEYHADSDCAKSG